MAKTGQLGDTASLEKRIRAASARMSQNLSTRGNPASKEAKIGFLLALGAGLSVQAAAAIVGVAEQTLRRERSRDDDFREQWEWAIEARSEPVEDRLQDIAMTGDAGSMATIKAAHIILQASNPRHRNRTTVTSAPNAEGKMQRI